MILTNRVLGAAFALLGCLVASMVVYAAWEWVFNTFAFVGILTR